MKRFLMRGTLLTLLATLAIGSALVAFGDGALKADPKLPKYERTMGVSGSIKTVGSDTMNNMLTLWAEGFMKIYPNVRFAIEGKGSSTAPPALTEGTATFGPMSRMMKSNEVNAFQKKFGYKPTPLRTSIDMLAVYVHKDNPIADTGLTLQQVDAIFSKTRKGGHPEDIATWGQLGLKGAWANKPISLYGRNSVSGTYGYFKKHALFGGDYKDSVKEQPGSAAVVQACANDKAAIGYSGIGYKTADVDVVPLSPDKDVEFVPAQAKFAFNGEYPLARFLYLYVNKNPNQPLSPLQAEFIKYIFSREGQTVVIKDGYFPVSANIAEKEMEKVGLEMKKAEE